MIYFASVDRVDTERILFEISQNFLFFKRDFYLLVILMNCSITFYSIDKPFTNSDNLVIDV